MDLLHQWSPLLLEGVPNGRRQIKQTQHMKQTKKEVKKRERAVPELFLEGFEGG